MNGFTEIANEFAGKIALVVGGSSGIGFSSALLMAKRGAKVIILADRGIEEAVAKAKSLGCNLYGITGDASLASVLDNAVKEIIKTFGGLNISVNSVAIHPYGNAVATDEDIWDKVMAINVKSVYLTAHFVIPQMQKQGGGAIVNISSGQATACQKDVSAYATSKAAILTFTRSLAVDFSSQGIRANIVSPGPIKTPLLKLSVDKFGGGRSEEEVYKDWGKGLPIGRVGEAHEVAEVVAFAASPRSSYCTGSEFVVDGGLLVKLGV